jgi:hypothetical protein
MSTTVHAPLNLPLLDAVDTLKALHESNSGTIGNFFTEFYCAKVC